MSRPSASVAAAADLWVATVLNEMTPLMEGAHGGLAAAHPLAASISLTLHPAARSTGERTPERTPIEQRSAKRRPRAANRLFSSCDLPPASHEPAPEPECLSWARRASADDVVREHASPLESTLSLDARLALMAWLDGVQARLGSGRASSNLLLRGVRPELIAPEHTDEAALRAASRFWRTSEGRLEHYALSEPVAPGEPLLFVSHCWDSPAGWAEYVGAGPSAAYETSKATELSFALQDLGLADERARQIRLWLDKACCPQEHPLLRTHLEMIDEFIRLSSGVVVLMPWHYFSRAWCVYEWAAALLHHAPSALRVCTETSMSARTLPLYVDAVRRLSVAGAECAVDADRDHLHAFVCANFVSIAKFERFVQGSAIALLGRSALNRAARASDVDGRLSAWVGLADELGFDAIASALRAAEPEGWRAASLSDVRRAQLRLSSPARLGRSGADGAHGLYAAGARRTSVNCARPPAGAVQPATAVPPRRAPGGRMPCAGLDGEQRRRSQHLSPPPRRGGGSGCRSAGGLRHSAGSEASGLPRATRQSDDLELPPAVGERRVCPQDWQDAYVLHVDRWFADVVEPALLALLAECALTSPCIASPLSARRRMPRGPMAVVGA